MARTIVNWTEKEIKLMTSIINRRRVGLSENNPVIVEVANRLGRSSCSIISKLRKIEYKKSWLDFVIKYSQGHTNMETAKRVGMSQSGVEKLMARAKNGGLVLAKNTHNTAEEVLMLMRSSYLPSYQAAQFIAKSSSAPGRMFGGTFNTGAKWVHGLSIGDYYDMFVNTPKYVIKSEIQSGPKRNKMRLVPWVVIEDSSKLNEQFKILNKYQHYLYGSINQEHALSILEELLIKPMPTTELVDMEGLKSKTAMAYKAYLTIKRYIKDTTTESHQKNRCIVV